MRTLQLFLLAALVARVSVAHALDSQAPASSLLGSRSAALSAIALLPLHFEPNVGQIPAPFQFMSRSEEHLLAITARSVQLTMVGSRRVPNSMISLTWVKGNDTPRLTAEQREPAVTNYFIGNDPRTWHTDVPNFKRLRYEGIYPGIDWVLHGNEQRLEYDFVVAANADPSLLKLKVLGAKQLSLSRDGDLLIHANQATVKQLKPVVYQSTPDGERVPIAGAYKVDGNVVSFAIGAYDHGRELIIDPVVEYSTYMGGSSGEFAAAIAVDSTGSAYVGGQTSSTDFPTLGAYQPSNKHNNAFVLKLNPAGDGLIYSTYLGGSSGNEEVRGIALDAAGNAYLTGQTFSRDFPVINPIQSSNPTSGEGNEVGFVTKLNPDGNALVYSTYLGGSGGLDSFFAIAVDSTGSAYVTGNGNSTDYPTTAGAFQIALRGRLNSYVSKLAPTGNFLVYSTYLGGTAADEAYGIAVDGSGEAVAVGNTNSSDFPLVSPYQNVNKGALNGNTGGTVFVSKLNASGTGLLFSTYLGGSVFDGAYAVAVDATSNVYVTGQTCSPDFPVVNPFQAANRSACSTGGPNVFVSKLSATGSALIYSTYLGGSGYDSAAGIAVDASGDAFVVGSTTSIDFPTLDPVQAVNKATKRTAGNAFVSELNPAGNALLFSTYLGGSGSAGNTEVHTTIPFGDSAAAVALDPSANIYIAGKTGSADFPLVGAFQSTNKTTTSYGSVYTAFIAKLSSRPAAPANLSSVSTTTQVTLSWSAVSGATTYNIYQSSSGTASSFSLIQSNVQSTSYTVTGLTSGTPYYFEVSAVGASSEGSKSSILSASTNKASSGGGGMLSPQTLLALTFFLILRILRMNRFLVTKAGASEP